MTDNDSAPIVNPTITIGQSLAARYDMWLAKRKCRDDDNPMRNNPDGV